MAAFAQNSANTIPFWNGTSFISSFGVTNTATYGETITVVNTGVPNVLSSIQFEMTCNAQVTYRAHVYAWDATNQRATGASLYDSGATVFPQSVDANTYTLVTVNTGGVTLPIGTYVVFLSTSQDQGGAPASACRWGALQNDTTYAGGRFVFINNGPDPTQWTTVSWSNIGEDLAFQVVFNNVNATPISNSALLMIAGLLALGFFLWMSRRPSTSPAS